MKDDIDLKHLESLEKQWEKLDQQQRSLALIGIIQQIEGMKALMESINDFVNHLIETQEGFLNLLSKKFNNYLST